MSRNSRINNDYSKNKRSKIVVGNVHADWCSVCKYLKPEWNNMEKYIKKHKGSKTIMFANIEEKDIDTKLKKLEQENNVSISVNGYPTIFKIENGKVHYYDGSRTSQKMANWYLKGGDPDLNLTNVQGGTKRRYYIRNVKRSREQNQKFNYSRHRRTRRNYYYNKKSQEDGIFDFLFGKLNN